LPYTETHYRAAAKQCEFTKTDYGFL
jgi:hypothetical protein